MEQLFNDIQQQIATKMGDTITLIDEDCGQLEALANGEDQYPVTFPCVLIGIPETIWETMKSGIQHGKTLSPSAWLSTATMIPTTEVRKSSTRRNAWLWPDA